MDLIFSAKCSTLFISYVPKFLSKMSDFDFPGILPKYMIYLNSVIFFLSLTFNGIDNRHISNFLVIICSDDKHI